MGITLLIMGLGLLYAQINEKLVLDLIAKWWPLIFVLLGTEILWQSWQARKNSSKITYDILGVFIIMILLCFGLTMEAMYESGLIEQCRTSLISQNYELLNASDPIPVDAGLKKVIIEQSSDPLEIVSCSTDKITASRKANVTSTSRNEAVKTLKESQILQTRRQGDTLYIAFPSSRSASFMPAGINSQYNTIYLPEDLQISIYSGVSDLKIHAARISNDWYINGIDSASLDLPVASNLLLTAQPNSRDELQGNASWEIKDAMQSGKSDIDEPEPVRTEGSVLLGTGQFKINIKSNGPVSLDILPSV
jgi:hypothetical protein